jgi:hypothetical protein
VSTCFVTAIRFDRKGIFSLGKLGDLLNCDRKFSVLLSTVKKKRVVYLGEDDAELGSKLIRPKTYVVPCPYCGADNEVTLP